jgi:hypothetical protein
VSPDGPQDFSKPVIYTVKAVDGTEKSYTVTVSISKDIPAITEFAPWKGSGPATARIDADLEKFVRLTLEGQVVDPAHYTLASGSTIITLSEAYLKTLPNGTYVFTAEFTDGIATLPLTVDARDGAAEIVLQAQEAGTLALTNRWNSDVIVSQSSSGGTIITVSAGQTTTLTIAALGETITVKESDAGATFKSWYPYDAWAWTSFVSGVQCALVALPEMSAFTTDPAGTVAGDSFFAGFNFNGSLTSLPAGSFDTSDIETVGDGFFHEFNIYGSLISLPEGSFDLSGIETVGNAFFNAFNSSGTINALPEGSFNISNIQTTGNGFFNGFNVNTLFVPGLCSLE